MSYIQLHTTSQHADPNTPLEVGNLPKPDMYHHIVEDFLTDWSGIKLLKININIHIVLIWNDFNSTWISCSKSPYDWANGDC